MHARSEFGQVLDSGRGRAIIVTGSGRRRRPRPRPGRPRVAPPRCSPRTAAARPGGEHCPGPARRNWRPRLRGSSRRRDCLLRTGFRTSAGTANENPSVGLGDAHLNCGPDGGRNTVCPGLLTSGEKNRGRPVHWLVQSGRRTSKIAPPKDFGVAFPRQPRYNSPRETHPWPSAQQPLR
jgi:hypothetical protein